MIDFVCGFGSVLTEVVEDPEVNTVVEVMGGTTIAKDVVFSAIKAGKNVVTANKALLAAFQPELSALLAQNPQVKFGYEAAVCGGETKAFIYVPAP